MSATTGAPPAKQERPASEQRRPDSTNLTTRYRQIGISAVAAALRYTDAAKNPAYAPVVIEPDPNRAEMAA